MQAGGVNEPAAGLRPVPAQRTSALSGWALGGVAFAAVMLVLLGTFQTIAGIVAIVDDKFYVTSPNYTVTIDVTKWGWIHLGLGVLMVVAGAGLFARRRWAGIIAIVLAVCSAVANFFFIPYYPYWSILVIALDVWVIWSLTRSGATT
jgi:hypothetical protein